MPRTPARPARVMGAFDQGQQVRIALVNAAKTDLGLPLKELGDILQEYIDIHYTPVWGDRATLEVIDGPLIPPGYWGCVFSDHATAADVLGFHDLTPDGFPLAHVFVNDSLEGGKPVSVTAAHELVECLTDPAASDGTWHLEKKVLYAKEPSDPVQEDSFEVRGVPVCSFVYPSWFEQFRKPGATKFDHLGHCTRPFHVLPGGYIPVLENGVWSYRFGSRRAERTFNEAAHPRLAWRRTWRGKKSKPKS